MTSYILAAVLAAAAADPRAAFLGTWRGTSTCVDRARHPACTDEVVIYEVREKPGSDRTVSLGASKVVDGKTLFMGELDFAYDAARGAWTSEMQNARIHALWSFAVAGGKIEGTLVDLPDGGLVRRVAVEKDRKPSKP